METHEYFEYYDSEKKKIKILKIFSKKNTKDEEIYRKIVEYANKYFSGYGNFHQKIENSIEINIPSYITDNKIKLYNLDKNIQSNIHNFLSISIKMDKKIIDYYYILNQSIDRDIIITKKYKIDGSQYSDKYQFYSYGVKGYSQNEIYYTIKEYNYVPHNHIINAMIHRIIFLYGIMIIISIFFIILFLS
jgi:hypothetical protein